MQAEASLPKAWRHPAFHEMRARIDALEEENRQLRAQLMPRLIFPRQWHLFGQMAILLGILFRAPSYRSAEVLCDSILRADGEPIDDKQLSVLLCRLRAKLKPFGIMIVNIRASGYALTPESREIIAKAVADVAEGRRV